MNVDEYENLLPEITEVNRTFWEGCEAGELRLQVCGNCGKHRFPDSPVCPRCLSEVYAWEKASGRATLWSWIVMHQKYFPAFADEVPYPVVFVQLEEGPFMMSGIVDDPATLKIDQSLEVVFEQVGGRTIPKFRVAA